MSTTSTASKKRKLGDGLTKYYAVKAGKKPGVYTSWKECQDNTTGFRGAQCRPHTYEDIELKEWIANYLV